MLSRGMTDGTQAEKPTAPRAAWRFAAAGLALLVLLGTGAAVSAWARGPGLRAARRAPARSAVVVVRPSAQRPYPPVAALARPAGAARALLGLALVIGLVLHLRRAHRVRWGATFAVVLAATFALGSGTERLLLPFEVSLIECALGAQRTALTPFELCLGPALLLAAGAGLGAAWRGRRAV
jgi:hypothetical protein